VGSLKSPFEEGEQRGIFMLLCEPTAHDDSCGSRNPVSSSWIPTFVGITNGNQTVKYIKLLIKY